MTEVKFVYSGDKAKCSKCGYSGGASTEYSQPGDACPVHLAPSMQDQNERLCRNCGRCGYHWDEAVLTMALPDDPRAGRQK